MKRAFPTTHRSAFLLQARVDEFETRAREVEMQLETLRLRATVAASAAAHAENALDARAFSEPVARQRARSAHDWARLFRAHPMAYVEAAQSARTGLWPTQDAIVAAVQRREAGVAVPWGGCGAMVCEATGSGKTRAIQQVILDDTVARVVAVMEAGGGGDVGAARFGHPTLIVVPKSLLMQWEREFAKFYSPAVLAVVRVAASASTDATTAALALDPQRITYGTDVVLTTYDTLRAAATALPATETPRGLFAVPWRRVVVDEGAAVVNENTNVFAACQRIVAPRRLFITATPVPNSRTSELNTILQFLGCGVRVPLVADASIDNGDVPLDAEQRARRSEARVLRQALVTHFLVRVGSGLGGAATPSPVPEIVWVPLSQTEERRVYAATVAQARAEPPERRLQWMGALRKACTSPVLLVGDSAARARLPADRAPSSKLAAVLRYERERMAPGEKALVFCEWLAPLRELGHHLVRAGVSYSLLSGDMGVSERQALVDAFDAPDSPHPRLLLLPYRIGALGLNLQRANHALLLAGHWSPALEDQANGRIARPGQTRPCHFVKFVAQGTIEEDILRVNRAKVERQGDVLRIDGEGTGAEEEEVREEHLLLADGLART